MMSRLAEIGERVYELNREALERNYMGKVVALCEKGVAGMGDSIEEAYKNAKKKYPRDVFYFRRVGPCPAAGHMFPL